MLQDRGAFPKEEGDGIGEYKVMHQDNFLSSWLREDGENKKGRRNKIEKGPKKRRAKKDERRGERRERDGDC